MSVAGWPVLLVGLHFDRLALWSFPYLVLLLYCAAFRGLITNFFFTNRWITAIGGMCYSIYLIHFEVISLAGRLTRRIAGHQPYWFYLLVQLALVGAAILLICGLYFVLLEKPCMRRDWPQRLRSFLGQLLRSRRELLAEGQGLNASATGCNCHAKALRTLRQCDFFMYDSVAPRQLRKTLRE